MADKTYAETQGEAPFDWNKAIADALKTQPDDDTHKALKKRAEMWTTCAVGNACAIIPRYSFPGCEASHGVPLDGELLDLGKDFFFNISDRDWRSAQNTLAAIEARSTILIREELAKRNAGAVLNPA